MAAMTKPAEVMAEIAKELRESQENEVTEEDREEWVLARLIALEDHLEDIDNARDFHSIGSLYLIHVILVLLHSSMCPFMCLYIVFACSHSQELGLPWSECFTHHARTGFALMPPGR